MSEKSIRWFCPICNDFVGIRKTDQLKETVGLAKALHPIIVKHGNPPHYTILQLDQDLRDRGRLTTKDLFDITEPSVDDSSESDGEIKVKLEKISEELSDIQQKIWALLDER